MKKQHFNTFWVINTFSKVFALTLVLFVSNAVFAKKGDEKVVEKARETVAEASPHDWQAYAKAAEMCIEKQVNLKEATQWLEKSLEIKETTLNTEIMGDYYAMNDLPEKAVEMYMKSMALGNQNDKFFDSSHLQQKMFELRKK